MTVEEQKAYKEITLFIVEDDDVDAMGIERALAKLKILNPMIRAKNGVECLAMLRDGNSVKRPFLLLLDLNMPQMNGLEVLQEIRNDPELADTVVFVLTTSKADEDRMAAYNLNVAGYIVKSQVGDGFMRVMGMLDHYWRVVELPVK